MIAPSPYAKGIPVWREHGMASAGRLIELFVSTLRPFCDPTVVEHSFLTPAAEYRAVFGDYANVYGIRDEAGGRHAVFRPDNMVQNVAWLEARREYGPLVAVGGLLRTLRGPAAPLFRDRYMWPAVQVTHLVARKRALETLDAYQHALEDCFTALGLPVVSVRTRALTSYGDPCYLAVSCLPDGRPTVLATSYVMAAQYRRGRALAEDLEILDIGFTGKVIALVAQHHWDTRGLRLPSAIAPVSLGVVLDGPEESAAVRGWLVRQRAEGLRAALMPAGERRYRRARAERRLHRRGTPLIVTCGGGREPYGIVRRAPLAWQQMPSLPAPEQIHAELAGYDQRLLENARSRFEEGLERSGMLTGLCPSCADDPKNPVFGWVTPTSLRRCTHCGQPGKRALVSATGRFY
jgi:prolyl-tRNA synthetase